MRLDEFREEVKRDLGDQLQRATPSSVQDFLTRMQSQLFHDASKERRVFELNEEAADYDEIVTQFFSRILESNTEQLEEALIMLWLVALELHFARLEQEYADRFASMFGERDLEDGC